MTMFIIFGSRKQFIGTKIPTLQETMSLTEKQNLLLFLEVKSNHKEVWFNNGYE